MVGYPELVLVFLENLYAPVCHQQIRDYLADDSWKFEPVAGAWRAHQHIFIFVAPINDEILRAGHSVVAFLYFVYLLHLITPVTFSLN